MKRKIRIGYIVIAVIVILALLASPRIRQVFQGTGQERKHDGAGGRLTVSAVVVRPEELINKVQATGTVLAKEELDLRSEISGKIDRILFTEGSRVQKGSVLVKIDDAELQAQRRKLESEVNVVQEKEQRRRALRDKQSISPEDYEVVMNELNGVKAELQLIEAKIGKTELRAPFDGLIGLRYVSEGSYVSPDTRIASLQDISQVKVDFSIPEKYAGSVQRGQMVYYAISGQEAKREARIYAIEPKIDPVTRNVLIRAIGPNTGGRIMPGAFAEVELVLERIEGAFLIPTQAIVPDLEGQKVFVSRGGLCQEARVVVGLRTEGKIQVTQGLAPGDTVLTSGLLQVVPGTPVAFSEVL